MVESDTLTQLPYLIGGALFAGGVISGYILSRASQPDQPKNSPHEQAALLKLQHEENARAHQRTLELKDRARTARQKDVATLASLAPALQEYTTLLRERLTSPLTDPYVSERQRYREGLVDELKRKIEEDQGSFGSSDFVLTDDEEDAVDRLTRMRYPSPSAPRVPGYLRRLIKRVCPEEDIPE